MTRFIIIDWDTDDAELYSIQENETPEMAMNRIINMKCKQMQLNKCSLWLIGEVLYDENGRQGTISIITPDENFS